MEDRTVKRGSLCRLSSSEIGRLVKLKKPNAEHLTLRSHQWSFAAADLAGSMPRSPELYPMPSF